MNKGMCAAVAAAISGYSCISGCASSGTAHDTPVPPLRPPRLGPTAAEMEGPLASNGNGKSHAAKASTVPPGTPLDDATTIETRRLHGYSFPGLDNAVSAAEPSPGTVTTELPTPVLAQDGQRFTALEDRLNQLESLLKQQPEALAARVRELEAKLATLEQRPVQEIQGTPAELAVQYEALSNRIAELEARPAPATEAPADQEVLLSRLQQMEDQLAALEQRPAQIITADSDPGEQYQDLATRLATLEARQAAVAEAPTLRDELQAMENRLAQLENRAPQTVAPATDAEVEARFDELNAKIAQLETPQTAPPPAVPDTLLAEMQAMEARLAELENRTPQQVQIDSGQAERQFNELRQQLAALEAREPQAAQLPITLEDQLQAMEARLAEIEQRPPAIIQTRPENMETRFNEMSAKLAQLEAQQQQVDTTETDTLRDRLQEMETKVASLENRPPQPAPNTDSLEARYNELQQQLAALEARPVEVSAIPAEYTRRLEQTEDRLAVLEQRPSETLHPVTPVEVTVQPVAPAYTGYDGPVVFARNDEYRLGAGDNLEFICFNDPTLSREEVVVRYDGNISLPGILDVPIAELTREVAEARIQDAYRSVFRNPRISLIVREALSRSFTVVGDVQDPGMYPYQQPVRLIEAISLAGGLRDRSSSAGSGGGLVGITGQLVKAFVIRSVDGERQVLDFDLRSLSTSGSHGSEAIVLPGDIIYIPEGVNLVYVLGEAENRVVEPTEGMTMLQLISLAGGFNADTAFLRRAVLMREVDDTNSEVMLVNIRAMLTNRNLDILLQPGDILYIPRRPLVRLQEFVNRFTGTISPVLGLYNEYITARYSRRISERLLEEDNSVLQTISGVTSASQQILDIIGR